MGRLSGKVALVTGAARGQGRAEALRFAEEGADLVVTDLCASPGPLDYPPSTPEDLLETVRGVEKLGRRVVSGEADVRDLAALEDLVRRGVDELGRLDIVVANAGMVTWGRFWEISPERWHEVIDINLTGVYNTLRASVPAMIRADNGGSIICTSSVAGLKALPGQVHYSASKHGIVGLANGAAIELAPYRIRVNTVHPWAVDTPMGKLGPAGEKVLADNPSFGTAMGHYLFEPEIILPEDVAAAVAFLASDDARTITGTQLTIDQGATKV